MPERLSKDELTILRYLTSIDGLIDVSAMYTTRELFASRFKINQIDDVLNHLLELDLIEKIEKFDGSFYYSASKKAKNTIEFIQEDKREKLIWSIYVPIGIAILTSLLVNIITFLIQK
ncbi:MAG: hypothetical protein KH084_16010 [Enterococcus gallinarum]|nr:hypothetical protein [Enterococcus gallinarum]